MRVFHIYLKFFLKKKKRQKPQNGITVQCMMNVWYDKRTTRLHHCISSLPFSSVMMLLMSVPARRADFDGFVHGKTGVPCTKLCLV